MRKAALLSVIVLLASLVLALPASAQGPGPRKGFVGTASGFTGAEEEGTVTTEGTLTLVLQGTGEEQEVLLPEGLKVRYPGREAEEEAGVDLQVSSLAEAVEEGSKVAVLAERQGDQWVALQVLVLPKSPVHRPVHGAVVTVEGRTLTVATPSGREITVTLGPEAEVPEVGEVVTAFVKGKAAAGLVRAEKVRERLERFRKALEEEGREEQAARIRALLEEHAKKGLELLERLSQRSDLPEPAREGMKRAIERAREALEKAKTKPEEERAGRSEEQGRGRLEGTVTALEDGTLTVDGTAVRLTDATRVEGAPEVGARVEVSAVRAQDGTLVAVEVEVKRSNEAEEEEEGPAPRGGRSQRSEPRRGGPY